MAQEDDATYYNDHKDDASEWGDPLPDRDRPTRRLGSMVSVRFAPEEVSELRAAADRENRSLSDFVRHAALSCAREKGWLVTSVAIGVSQPGVDRHVHALHNLTGVLGSGAMTTTSR
jgi:uncharacterized protein (DUF1778 family)